MFSFLFEPCASVVTLLMAHLVFTGCCCVHLVVLLTCKDPSCLSVANTYTKGNNHSSYLFPFLALVLACVCLSQAGVCIGNHFQCKPFWFLARLVVLLACGSFRCVRMGKKRSLSTDAAASNVTRRRIVSKTSGVLPHHPVVS